MGGLINGAFAGGAAPGISRMGEQLVDYGMKENLMKEELAARSEMEARIAERNVTTEATQHARNRGEAMEDQGTAQKNALELQDRKEGKTENQSQRAALASSLTDIRKEQDRLEVLKSTSFDDAQKTTYETRIDKLSAESDRIRTALNKLGGLDEPDKPKAAGIDDMFPVKAKPGGEGGAAKTAATPAKPTTTPAPQADPVAHLLDPRNVTPYADKLKALMDMQPNQSAPQAEQEKWQAALVKLKASQNTGTGLINRAR